LKKVEKAIRPFSYDLNQIPYDYTVEVANRFNGLDLLDGVPEELWTEIHEIVQEAVILEPIKIKFLTVSTVAESVCHEVMGPDAMIFVF